MKANTNMATKKTKILATEPVVTRGSHSTRTEYPDGRVEFETHWDELVRDVEAALADYAKTKPAEKPEAVKKAEPKSKIVKAMESTKKAAEKSLKKAPAKKTVAKPAVKKAVAKAPAKKTATKAKKTK